MKKTPLYIIEEHHEAFYAWNVGIDRGAILPVGNTLLHVDHHSDLEYGSYPMALEAVFGTLAEKEQFTYSALGIADFIYPAIFEGVFNELVFIKNFSLFITSEKQQMITLADSKTLAVGESSSLMRQKIIDAEVPPRFFTHREGGLGAYTATRPVVLDIDIDYFCWDDALTTVPEKMIEITKEAYEDFTGNKRHPLRLLPRRLVNVKAIGDRYYLCAGENCLPEAAATEETIEKRINAFGKWLVRCQIQPAIIDLCRSRQSGYCPADKWEAIEALLLKKLAEIYDYEAEYLS